MHEHPAHDQQDQAPGAVTVADLVAEELLRDTLVAGGDGTDRLVEWCLPGGRDTATDADPQDVTRAAVFVPSADLASHGSTMLPRLAERGASAVFAWPGPTGVHPDLAPAVSVGEAVGLPLLRLGAGATFRATSQLVATKVLAQSTHVLEYGTRVHRVLGDVFAKGAGLVGLTETMARLSGAEVLVLGNVGESLARSHLPRNGGLPDEALRRLAEDLTERGPVGPGAEVLSLEVAGRLRHLVVTPVRVAGQDYGQLVLVEPSYPTDEHDLAQHTVMSEEGVSLTGSELLRQQSVRDAQERARNDFVHALLHNRFTDSFEVAARAEHYEFPVDGRFAVFIAASPEIRPDEATSRRRAAEVRRLFRGSGGQDGTVALSALIGSMIVVVKQVPDASTWGRGRGETTWLRDYATQLHRAAVQRLGTDVRVAYGRACDGVTGVATSYREARTAEALGKQANIRPVAAYEDMRLYAALEASATSTAGQALATEMLGPLQQADGQTGNLANVVLAYIEEAGNLNAAARKLHLHRNTMLYKLDRASRALGMDIRTTEAQFMVWLAHHFVALGGIEAQLDEELSPPA